MPRLLLLLALVASALPAAAQHDSDEERPPFELGYARPDDGPLSRYLRFREAVPLYADGSAGAGFVRQQLAQYAALHGRHAEALHYDAIAYGTDPDTVAALPAGVRAVDAVAEIVRRADSTRVVMVNERHHDASDRLLTLDLLAPLYERGYRYLAAETFAPDSILSTVTDYPTVGMGYYSDEPVFGALVREALRLGYVLVPYEARREDEVEDDTLSGGDRREYAQAEHLATVLNADPDARILVHAGYGHINEIETEYMTPMAWYVRALTGIDPLTVDQTYTWGSPDPAESGPFYRAALAAGLVDETAVILVDADGQPVSVQEEGAKDLYAVREAVERPVASLDYAALRPLTLPAACGACVVEVQRADEGADAVPVDRMTVLDGGTVRLVGPTDVPLVVTVVEGRTGALLDRRIATAR